MATQLGFWTASFLLAGLLPAAFIFYGRSNDKGWASTSGYLLAVLLGVLPIVGNGLASVNLGHIAGFILVGYAATKHYPRKFAPEPGPD